MYHCHAASMRSENSYVKILSPTQTMRYQEWLAKNRDRFAAYLQRRRASKREGDLTNQVKPKSTNSHNASAKDNASLLYICRKLEALLKISDDVP